jgi:hypothetical protein
MNGGKWRYLMDAAPRRLPVFEDVHANLTQGDDSFVTLPPSDITKELCYKPIQMLGHSMEAIALPKDGQLTYNIEVDSDGAYTISTRLIPTHPSDDGDLRFSVSIDNGEPVVYSLKEPFRSERWKDNVLRGQAVREMKIHLQKGRHTAIIRAIDNHIIIDQIFLYQNVRNY